ncbi:hypothetical protein NDU88_012648, partial [Pleurodeles waltl]
SEPIQGDTSEEESQEDQVPHVADKEEGAEAAETSGFGEGADYNDYERVATKFETEESGFEQTHDKLSKSPTAYLSQ